MFNGSKISHLEKKIEIGFSFSGRGYEVSAVSNWGRLQMPFGGAINDLALLHHYLVLRYY